MQLFCGGLGFRPALHIQLFENVADMGLHGRQLHIHDLRDLGVGLVRAEQMENLQLRGFFCIFFIPDTLYTNISGL